MDLLQCTFMVSTLRVTSRLTKLQKPNLYDRALRISRQWARKSPLTAMAIAPNAAEATQGKTGGAWENQRYYYAFGWYAGLT